ncbi:F-box protein SKIP14 [Quillaja saponaria]|uniref:F-box protein SKIP14 n=1 Tax=Quillaja saponaria TaxID=32244 RepID=A0AAD7PWR8_QUISA|nr:F-box protein SKIP14 [Quillaja saponaria]
MAMNFSRGSSFPTSSEKSLSSSIGKVFDDFLVKNYGCFANSWNSGSFNKELLDIPSGDLVKSELGEATVVVDDILDWLPKDPFDMDTPSTFSAISDWLQDFERDFGFDEFGINYGLYNGGFVEDGNVDKFLTFSHMSKTVISNGAKELQDCTRIHPDGEGGALHDAMFFVLGYLGVHDLLSVEMVCRSLRDAVRSDPLLWRSIHIDQPLSERIMDDALMKLTGRAQGTLQRLSLVGCVRITDTRLKCVFESNPRLVKLSVLGCVRLTVEGILFNLRALKSFGIPGIKHLRIGGLSDVTDQQFEELKYLLDANKTLERIHKPRFYRGGQSFITSEDDRAIDIEVFPRCEKLRLVYDCPVVICQQKHQATQLCRGCTMCIARCIHCGCCITDCDYEVTFFLDLLCLDCWAQLRKGQDRPVEKGYTNCTVIRQRTMYQFCLYG